MKAKKQVDYAVCAEHDKQALKYLQKAIVAGEQASTADTLEAAKKLRAAAILCRLKAIDALQHAMQEVCTGR